MTRKPLRAPVVAVALGAALLAILVAGTLAAPRYVAPNKVRIKVKDIVCPGTAQLKMVVWSKRQGSMKVALEQKGTGLLGSDIIVTKKKVRRGFKGMQSGTISLVPARSKTWYRLIATDGNKTRKSKWISIASCAIS